MNMAHERHAETFILSTNFCYLHCITNAIHFACKHIKTKNILYTILHIYPILLSFFEHEQIAICIMYVWNDRKVIDERHVEITRNLLQINVHQIFKWIGISMFYISKNV